MRRPPGLPLTPVVRRQTLPYNPASGLALSTASRASVKQLADCP